MIRISKRQRIPGRLCPECNQERMAQVKRREFVQSITRIFCTYCGYIKRELIHPRLTATLNVGESSEKVVDLEIEDTTEEDEESKRKLALELFG